MRIPPILLWVFLLVLSYVPPTAARPVRIYDAQTLAESAEIICNGIPVKIEKTEEKIEVKFYGGKSTPRNVVVATIRVIGKFKGEVPAEIEFRYTVPLPDDRLVINGPDHIGLELNTRYRFYLKRPDPASQYYVGVLHGNFDDGPAVEALLADESDTQPPLLKADALAIASKYLVSALPDYQFRPEWTVTSAKGYDWEVLFYSKEPRDYPASTNDAKVVVTRRGVIGADTYITTGAPKEGKLTAKKWVGRKVIMNANKVTRTKVAGQTLRSVEFLQLRGGIQELSSREIVGFFSKRNGKGAPFSLRIPQVDILTVQEIVLPR